LGAFKSIPAENHSVIRKTIVHSFCGDSHRLVERQKPRSSDDLLIKPQPKA
jgi:hypothetical protein